MKSRGAWGCVLCGFLLQRRSATETQMHCLLSCTCSPESKAQHQCLLSTKAWEGAGDICQWELGFTPCREGTYSPLLQEHQHCRPSLLTGHGCPVWTSGAPKAWMEPAGLLSLTFAEAPAARVLAYVLSLLALRGYQSITHDANIPLRNKGWRSTCRQPTTLGKRQFPTPCTSSFLLSCNSQEAGSVFLKERHLGKCSA